MRLTLNLLLVQFTYIFDDRLLYNKSEFNANEDHEEEPHNDVSDFELTLAFNFQLKIYATEMALVRLKIAEEGSNLTDNPSLSEISTTKKAKT